MKTLFKPRIKVEEALEGIREVLESGWVGEGPKTKQFAEELQNLILPLQTRKAVLTNSGTAALRVALELSNVRGRHVISTPNTFIATNTAILEAGGKIIWADVHKKTGLIKPESISNILSKRYNPDIAAIVCVDLAGTKCNYKEIANSVPPGTKIIQDAAQAFGPGSLDIHADYTCYSFQAIKFLTTIDGGCVFVKRHDFDKARKLTYFGIDRELKHKDNLDVNRAGFKCHMNDVNAAIGLANLKQAVLDVLHARYLASCYQVFIENSPFIYKLPVMDSSYWCYIIHVMKNRESFIKHLRSFGYEAATPYKSNNFHSCFNESSPANVLGSESYWKTAVALPTGPDITVKDIENISGAIKSWTLMMEKA